MLATPPLGLINVHASLLPRYRGAAPVHRAIIAGETRNRRHHHARGQGARRRARCWPTVRRPIGPDDTSDEVERDLRRLGADLLVATTDDLASGRCHETPQDDAAGHLRPSADERRRDHRLELAGRSGAQSHPRAAPLAARVHVSPGPPIHPAPFDRERAGTEGSAQDERTGHHRRGAGDRLVVATGAGRLRLTEIQAEGKRPMSAREFLAGHRLTAGERFTDNRLARRDRAGADRGLRDPQRGIRRQRRPAHGDRVCPRRAARRPRPRAGGGDRHRRPALARGARPPDRRVLQARHLPARSGDRRDSPPQRVSAAAPDARAGVRRRGRCGQPGRARGQAERERASSTRCCGRSRGGATRCRCRRGPPIRPIATAALDYFSITLSHPRWLAARWYDRLGFDAAEAWQQFNNAPGPVTLRANRLRMTPQELVGAARGRRRPGAPGRLRARRPHRRRGLPAARCRARRGMVRRAGRGVAARHAAGRRASAAARARHLRVAGRQDHGACRGDGGARPARRLRRARSAGRPPAPDRGRDRRGERAHRAGGSAEAAAVRARRSTACWSTPRAPAWARCAAIRTSAGAGAKPISPRLPPRS